VETPKVCNPPLVPLNPNKAQGSVWPFWVLEKTSRENEISVGPKIHQVFGNGEPMGPKTLARNQFWGSRKPGSGNFPQPGTFPGKFFSPPFPWPFNRKTPIPTWTKSKKGIGNPNGNPPYPGPPGLTWT